ncbi:MAG: AsmA-like C-terminal region-containing protein, partial [Pseudomonadota bacterium]
SLPAWPAPLAATERQTAVSVRFRDRGQTSEQWLSLTQPVVGGWLTLRDGLAVDGHVHVLGTPEAAAAGAPARFARRQLDRGSGGRGIRITGGISSYDLAETGEGGLASLRFEFDDFHVADLRAYELALGYVNLSGTLSDPLTELAVTGARLDGTVSWVDGQPMQLAFRSVLLPQMNGGGPSPASLDTREVTDALVPREPDPLPVTLVRELPEADVSLGSLRVGDEDFGRWQFKLRRQDDRLRIDALEADWLGLHITGDEVYWSRSPNETVFVGSLAGGNLDDVLPAWDYASPVTTEDVAVEVEVAWSGSPLNILLTELEGEAELTLRNGRFHEVEGAGNNALRLLSLLNFNAITRRMNLDFSDVFGRGVSFETLTARAALDHGRLVLLKPMEVEGTGSRFVMSGSVDVNTGLIDSEMIVTLPLTRGLPWYAAYVALAANPLAGLGVLVGERVLRKPLEQFSSAKYEVTGTLSDPDVRLVGIFNNKLKRIDPDEQVTEIPVAENEETKQRNDNGTGES